MDKTTKRIVIAVVGMICVAALVLVAYYLISQGKIGSGKGKNSSSSEVEKLLNKDLESKYPEIPTEVVKLYWRFNKCIYNNSMSDKEFEGLLEQLRLLYDEELLAESGNSWDNMYDNLKKDKEQYAKDSQVIATYAVQKSSTVNYATIDGKECATVVTGTSLKAKSKREQTYEKFMLRKDSKGNWRILGWEQTTNPDDISVLGDK
ncbi:MAG: hypothetical protein J1E62_08745 [Lachnospiraceae bacterium]|nr:hypothetical protein [Lachnospiraceae bacterium]